MPARYALPILLFSASVFPQMPVPGDFYYKLAPREALIGQPVGFQAFEFNMCLYDYDVTYESLPTPISSKRTTILSMKAKRKPECAAAAGYSGPRLVFENLPAGAYILQFDSTSDFKRDLGDTNRFEVLPPASIADRNRTKRKPAAPWEGKASRRLDGKALPGRRTAG